MVRFPAREIIMQVDRTALVALDVHKEIVAAYSVWSGEALATSLYQGLTVHAIRSR